MLVDGGVNGACRLFSWMSSWLLSWLTSCRISSSLVSLLSLRAFSWVPVFSLRLSFSRAPVWHRRHHRRRWRVGEREALARARTQIRWCRNHPCRVPLPLLLPLQNLLRATRCRRRCRRTLLLRHVHRALDRRTSLLLLISVAAGSGRAARLQAQRKLKDHRKTSAGTAPDYSMTFGAHCKDSGHVQSGVWNSTLHERGVVH